MTDLFDADPLRRDGDYRLGMRHAQAMLSAWLHGDPELFALTAAEFGKAGGDRPELIGPTVALLVHYGASATRSLSLEHHAGDAADVYDRLWQRIRAEWAGPTP